MTHFERAGAVESSWLPPYGRYRFAFSMPQGIRLPEWPGSAWRGAFGWALRDLVCVTGAKTCNGCLLARDCTYQRLFESAADSAQPGGITTHTPHPFVLFVPPADAHRTDALLEMRLLGHAIHDLPAVVTALARAGERGIGGSRNRLKLRTVEQWSGGCWQPIYRPDWAGLRQLPPERETSPYPGGRVVIRLTSPLRLKHEGRLVDEKRLTPRIFLHALYARMRSLSRLGTGHVAERWPEVPAGLRFPVANLRWLDLDRYSSRQGRRHRIGGLLGEFALDLDGLEAAWPVLWHGQYLHVGKMTSLGHGGYHIRFPDSQSV